MYKIVSRSARTSLGMEIRICDYVTSLSVTNHVDMFLGIRHENIDHQGKFGLVVGITGSG